MFDNGLSFSVEVCESTHQRSKHLQHVYTNGTSVKHFGAGSNPAQTKSSAADLA